MPGEVPVLAICGYSGSGKTTLIEAVVPGLVADGLRVAVVKHDTHGLQIDRPGKDSDRLYRAGADVHLEGPGESLVRAHDPSDDLVPVLADLCRRYDLVLVEGRKHSPVEKVWLLRDGETESAAADVPGVVARLARDIDRPAWLRRFIGDWLPRRWRTTPVHGCILIGGRSRRMGRPKHLIRAGGRTWLERTVERLDAVADRLVIVGDGEIPESLRERPRLSDCPDCAGPLAGILAAMRWAPDAGWLVVACDLPDLDHRALDWLLAQRRPGRWAIVPCRDDGRPEPLLAYYDPRALPLLESLRLADRPAPRRLVDSPRCHVPTIPGGLAPAWRNVNAPDGLDI